MISISAIICCVASPEDWSNEGLSMMDDWNNISYCMWIIELIARPSTLIPRVWVKADWVDEHIWSDRQSYSHLHQSILMFVRVIPGLSTWFGTFIQRPITIDSWSYQIGSGMRKLNHILRYLILELK